MEVGIMKTMLKRLGLTLVALTLLAAGAAPTEAATRKYTQIAAGGEHACAITSRGDAYCWGSNADGQLGNGNKSNTPSLTAVAVVGGYRFTSIAASKYTTCAITSSGRAYCWGADDNTDGYSTSGGMLGGGFALGDSDSPVAVLGGRRFTSISAGTDHFCGLTSDGRAYCWGGNSSGQLGDGTTDDKDQPVAVSGSVRFVSITTAHEYTCGITQRGVFCWGQWFGVTTPTLVPGGRGIVRLEATEFYTSTNALCGLTRTGKLMCLEVTGSYAPVPIGFKTVDGAPKYVDLAVGSGEVYRLCGLRGDGSISCWGSLGDILFGASTDPVDAVKLETELKFKAVTQGGLNAPEEVQFSCGLTKAGAAYCWGSNAGGQLGNGTQMSTEVPQAVQ